METMIGEVALKLIDVGVSIGLLTIGLAVMYKHFSKMVERKDDTIAEKDSIIKDLNNKRVEDMQKLISLMQEVNDRYDNYVSNIGSQVTDQMKEILLSFSDKLRETISKQLESFEKVMEKNMF